MGAIHRLTARSVEAAKPRKNGKAKLYCDGGGLYLQVTLHKPKDARRDAGGVISKSWLFKFRSPVTDKIRALGLGRYDPDVINLKRAREARAAAALIVASGGDPIEDRRTQRQNLAVERLKTITFRSAVPMVIEAHRAG